MAGHKVNRRLGQQEKDDVLAINDPQSFGWMVVILVWFVV